MKKVTANRLVSGRYDGEGALEDDAADLAEGDESRVGGMKNCSAGGSVVNQILYMLRGESARPDKMGEKKGGGVE
jgi:hypothetical protein